MAHLRTLIVTLTPSKESELMEKQFERSFILYDIAGLGPDKVERLLHNRFKRDSHRWIVIVYAEYQYLIQAPTKVWLDSMSSQGFLLLAGVEFPILAWRLTLMKGWTSSKYGFESLDSRNFSGRGSKWRRILTQWEGAHLLELDPVENERTKSVHAWLNRLKGRPSPNGTELGIQPVVEDEMMPGAEGVDLADEDLLNENEGMEKAQMTPCRMMSGAARKRDDDDSDAPGSGKKGSKGKFIEGSKPGGSGTKTGTGTKPVAASGSRSRTKPISPTPASSPSVHSTIPFQPLSIPTPKESDNEDEPILHIINRLSHVGKSQKPVSPLVVLSHLKITPEIKKQTWGSKKNQSPLTLKKKMSFAGTGRSGIVSRLRNSRKSAEILLIANSSEQSLPNINTFELADTTAFTDKKVIGQKKAPKMAVPRKSLRVQAKADPSSTMIKVVKRVRDKEIGCSSSTGSLFKKVKQVADEWLPVDIKAIPIRVWDPSTNQSPLYLQDGRGLQADGIGMLALDGAAGTPAN